jgi:hypothetical protein
LLLEVQEDPVNDRAVVARGSPDGLAHPDYTDGDVTARQGLLDCIHAVDSVG